MKQLYKYALGALSICLLTSQLTYAQGIGATVSAAESDASLYLGNYFKPAIVSASNGLANGWNNTAKPHKLFGFDITATFSVAGIPDADYVFNFVSSEYNTLRLAGGGAEAEVPTFIGGDPSPGVMIEAYETVAGNEVATDTFAPPSGLDLSAIPGGVRVGVPIPMANIGIGLPKNTELRIRFIPIKNIGDDISVDGSFGIGVLHDIKQWIPGMKLVPIDISAFVGYNQFKFSYDDGAGNIVNFNSKATTIQVLASKKLLFFTPYIGLGTNIINTDFGFTVTDPNSTRSIDGDYKYDKLGGARFTVGGRLKILWVLALNVDYTFQRYNTFNIGLGINVR